MYLDGNCLRIHTKSAFIEFHKSPGLTFTQVRTHRRGESSDVKEPTICHKSTTNIYLCIDVLHSYHLDIIIHDNINDVNDINNIIIKTQEVINCLSWVFKGSATQRRKNHGSKVAMLPGKFL